MFHEIEKVSDFAKENNMFRKSLTALALMGVASHGAASTLATAGEVVVTPEAAKTLTVVGANDFTLTIVAASVATGSVANITFTKAPANPNTITAAHTDTDASGAVVLSYSGATNGGKTLNYTASDVLTATDVITFGGAEFAIADVTSTPITVDASFTDVGTGIDPAAAKLELITLTATNQFGLDVTTDADAVVDVEAARYAFVGADDDIVFATTDTDGDTEALALGAQQGTVQGATLTGVTYTLSGDFAWAEDIAEDPVVAGFQLAAGAVACAGGGGVTEGTGDNAPTATAYTFSTADGTAVTCTLTPQAPASKIVLPTAEFEVSSTVAYTDLADVAVVAGASPALAAAAGTQAVAAEDAGEWTINGAETTVFAVPFGSEVESHSIFVSNSGDTTGAISASMRWNGNDPVVFSLGNIEAGANKYLNIIEALTAAGELPPFGRADITFTVNAPKAAIAITAGYNTANGRTNLFVEDQTPIDTL